MFAVARFSTISTASRLMGFTDLFLGGLFSGFRFHGDLVFIVHLDVVFRLLLDGSGSFFHFFSFSCGLL